MKIAFIPGTFNPPTLGHYSLIVRAAKLFDRVVVGISKNILKSTSLFTDEECLEMMKTLTEGMPQVEVALFSELAVDFAKKQKASVFLRGIRNSLDMEFEKSLALANFQLAGIETMMLFADPSYAHISSSLVREIAAFGGDLSGFVPPEIIPFIQKKYPKSVSTN